MEPVNKVFLCLRLHANSAGGRGGTLHSPQQLWLRGWEKAHLPGASEDSGMCVLSHLFPAGFQGAGLHEVNLRPDS